MGETPWRRAGRISTWLPLTSPRRAARGKGERTSLGIKPGKSVEKKKRGGTNYPSGARFATRKRKEAGPAGWGGENWC